MKKLFFKAKAKVDVNEMKNQLEKNFPNYEFIIFGALGKGIKAKKTNFRGARIIPAGKTIFVRKTCPTLMGNLIDTALFGMISGSVNNKISGQLIDFLKQKYA